MRYLRYLPLVLVGSSLAYVAANLGADLPGHQRTLPVCATKPCRHVHDAAGVLPPQDLPRFEDYLENIQSESDVDIRFVFIRGTGNDSIEDFATKVVDELRIGGQTRAERGLLLLYDVKSQRLKIEVGYGLEGYFPDVFINYLVDGHARMFFASGDLSVGLRLLLRLLQHRIREAVLGNDFDPRVVETLRSSGHLSGGAGVRAALPLTQSEDPGAVRAMSLHERSRYAAGDSPEATFARYLDWLSNPKYDPGVELFTASSRAHLGRLPASPAYRHFILFGEYGKSHRVARRGDLAVLYFTDTPFTSPHFFVRDNDRWLMDIAAEVSNTVEFVGVGHTWGYRGVGDRYTVAFSDLLTEIGGVRRFKDGDNRRIRIRGSQ